MAEKTRVILGFVVVAMGLGALLIVMFAALNKFEKVSDVTALIASVGAVVGPIIGAFFGVQVGAAGKSKADEDRAKAEKDREKADKKFELLAGSMREQDFDNFLKNNKNLF